MLICVFGNVSKTFDYFCGAKLGRVYICWKSLAFFIQPSTFPLQRSKWKQDNKN